MKTVLAATIILPVATLWMVSHSTQREADPNIAIKKRLRDFIALTDSMDFDGKTENQHDMGHEEVLAAREEARTLLSKLA
ncbi:hypothetical protein [Spirosoma validum]|uniref:Uncharacterized protein n=1 Tax=Spirosoma validum TaxID=2771355 RepID=A0A927B195_9BACT|nr:hypothetical protein [Spirosoma validum]MBD2753694.1 hypothetical protein [Spirosoma validum]